MKKDLLKPCQPYIEGDGFLCVGGISVVFFGVNAVIFIIFPPAIVLCFPGRFRIGILIACDVIVWNKILLG